MIVAAHLCILKAKNQILQRIKAEKIGIKIKNKAKLKYLWNSLLMNK